MTTDIDVIKSAIEQHDATPDDCFVVSDDVYADIRQGVQASLEQHDELIPGARISIANVLIIPFSKFRESPIFDREFSNESLIFIKNIKTQAHESK